MTDRTTLVQRLRQMTGRHDLEAADELDRLQRELASAQAELAYARSTGDECALEVDGLRKDAERYRWLRTDAYPQHVIAMGFGAELDAAIDTAMKEGER
jgi:multidrug resistance efflux pump